MSKLPKEILHIKNADKGFHEKWTKGRDPLNIPHPFRCVLMGKPNSGKSTIIKNLILRALPEFEKVIIVHCDPENTREYDDLGENIIMLGDIPSPEEWNAQEKTLCILDDIELTKLPKDQKRCLSRLFGYVSTHKNVSVCLTSQDCFSIDPLVRRCSNLWVIWKPTDLDAFNMIGKKCGMTSAGLNHIFDKFMPNTRDSLWIDLTDNSPFPLRKNGYEMLQKITK